MKILVYSANFAPEPTGIGKYSGEMCEWLAANGHEVRVVCAPPYYPAWQHEAGYRWPLYRREHWHGVDVWRAPLWVPSRPRGLARVLHLFSFAVASLPVMLWQATWRPDAVLTVAPALVCAPAGWLVARLSGATCWLHLQDFEIDVAFQMGLLRGGPVRRVAIGLERWMLKRFDIVSSISRRMMQRLVAKGVDPDRLRPLPNWVDVDRLRPLEMPSSYREELGIPATSSVVLFSGTLGGKQDLMLIPECARLLAARSDIVFVVCGDGVMKQELAQATSLLANVHLLPLQPAERLADLLGLADVHLLTQSLEAEDLVLPSKLSGMLASGRPVVATSRAGTEIADVLSGCGTVVDPGNPVALANALVDLIDDVPRRHALGEQARRHAEQFMARDAVLQSLQSDLCAAAARSPTGAAKSSARH